jgi:hypothetical protein
MRRVLGSSLLAVLRNWGTVAKRIDKRRSWLAMRMYSEKDDVQRFAMASSWLNGYDTSEIRVIAKQGRIHHFAD